MLNILSILPGIVICFFSICIRRILSAIIGFIYGAAFGFLLAFLINLFSSIGTAGFVVIILIFAVLIAIISYKYYRFFVFLNTFLVSFISFFNLVQYLTNSSMSSSVTIAIVLATVVGIVSAILYDPLFIISTAFFGGTLISFGVLSMYRGTDIVQLARGIIWNESGLIQVIILTIILGVAGIIVQFILLKKLNIGHSDTSYKKSLTANKKCRQCSEIYTGSSNCPKCGFSLYEEVNISIPNSNIAPPINKNFGDTWVCKKCSETNSTSSTSCKGCGEYK